MAESTDTTAPSSSSTKPRYDWYQTTTHVVVTVLLKNTHMDDLVVDTKETMLKVHTKQSDGQDFDLEIHLAHPVDPDQTVSKVLASKIEIKLKKMEGIQWAKLEGDGQKLNLKLPDASPSDHAKEIIHKYPTSSHYYHDWDKIAQEVKEEEKNEKLDGDAAINRLFQQIYSDGTDETRRAMIKSFSESGGTVLSTNWNEVQKEKIDVKPPDGMEFKKFEI